MEQKHIRVGKRGAAVLLIGCMFAATSSFAQERTGSGDMPKPKTQKASCDVVNWQTGWDRELLERMPNMEDGCHEVVVVDGTKWIRFEADFLRMNNDGSIVSDFKSPRNRSIGNLTLMPSEDQRVLLDGKKFRFSELKQGQKLNFYVPEGTLNFASTPEAPPKRVAKVVEVKEPTRLAEVDKTTTREQPKRLPSTAGPLPLIATGGFVFLLGGLGLGIRRWFGSSQ
jgi:hypothetical protein